MDVLLDFETIPTGSIHWFPVTIEQYKSLVKNNGNWPNRSHFIDSNTEYKVDPLVRDFLLCDGRQYNIKDFPELAKILWGEPIHRWIKCDEIGGESTENIEKKYYFPYFDKTCNFYGPKNEGKRATYEDYTFRVPDLRHMFISSIYHDGLTTISSGKAQDPSSYNTVTGTWTIDNNASSSTSGEDNHRHFIAYGTYDALVNNPNIYYMWAGKDWTRGRYWSKRNFPSPIYTDLYKDENNNDVLAVSDWDRNLAQMKNTKYEEKPDVNEGIIPKNDVSHDRDYTHVLTLNNNIVANYTNSGYRKSFRGFHYTRNLHGGNGIQAGTDSIPTTMILSIPNSSSKNFDEWGVQGKINVGLSSYNVDSLNVPTSYNQIDGSFLENIKAGEEYKKWEDQEVFYSSENTPKYYAFLPFIKI